MSSDANHLQQALDNLRSTLAQKRAARKAQNDAQMSAFPSTTDYSPSTANALLERASRVESVLGQLQGLSQSKNTQALDAGLEPHPQVSRAAKEHTAIADSPEEIIDPKIPDAQELAAFRQALMAGLAS